MRTSIIIVRMTHLTVALCIYVVVLYLFYYSQYSQSCFYFTFKQRIMILMCMLIHGTLKTVTEISKTMKFQDRIFLYWLTNILIIFTSL